MGLIFLTVISVQAVAAMYLRDVLSIFCKCLVHKVFKVQGSHMMFMLFNLGNVIHGPYNSYPVLSPFLQEAFCA